jgi:hypothetical protein
VLGLSGCRVHELEDGSYRLALTQVLRDECGLAQAPDTIGAGVLSTTGNLVGFDYAFLSLKLQGTYLSGVEQLTLDGAAVNIDTLVSGQECLVDQVAMHLDGTAKDATHFSGKAAITYDTRQPDRCVCKFWFLYDATRGN